MTRFLYVCGGLLAVGWLLAKSDGPARTGVSAGDPSPQAKTVRVDPTLPVPVRLTLLGCREGEDITKAAQLYADHAAFELFVARQLRSGACTKIEAGSTVFVTDRSTLRGLYLVRRRGEVDGFWVPGGTFENAV